MGNRDTWSVKFETRETSARSGVPSREVLDRDHSRFADVIDARRRKRRNEARGKSVGRFAGGKGEEKGEETAAVSHGKRGCVEKGETDVSEKR